LPLWFSCVITFLKKPPLNLEFMLDCFFIFCVILRNWFLHCLAGASSTANNALLLKGGMNVFIKDPTRCPPICLWVIRKIVTVFDYLLYFASWSYKGARNNCALVPFTREFFFFDSCIIVYSIFLFYFFSPFLSPLTSLQ
jgi:hypothetical protein